MPCFPNSKEWEFLLPAFGVSAPDLGHSKRCIDASHCFNLHLSDDIGWGASFHLLICHLYVFFGKACVRDFNPFFNQVVCFTGEFEELFLYFGKCPLSGMSFANIFSQPVASLFIFLTSSAEQKILIVMIHLPLISLF